MIPSSAPFLATELRPPAAAGGASDDQFCFHPRATNPELWRTTVPLVVRERCGRHKGLVATWTAIHWLIVLHAGSGRCDFGVRDIAEEAGVGRNELTGPTGHIQRLVSLGLLQIVDYRSVPGFREPRPVYQIDLVDLERRSLELVPAVLGAHHVRRPPPLTPDPRQLALFSDADLAPTAGPAPHPYGAMEIPTIPALPGAPAATLPAGPATPADGTGTAPRMPALRPAPHPTGTDRPHSPSPPPGNGTGSHPFRPDLRPDLAAAPGNGTGSPGSGTAPPGPTHPTTPDLARFRDIDRPIERMIEGARDTLAPDLLQQIVAQTVQAVLATLQQRGALPADTASPLTALQAPPPTPPDAEPLPAGVLALWQGDRPACSTREQHQLALLVAEYDGPTDGHGAYWVGRAILMADLCLTERGQPLSLAYLRRVLRRWRNEGSWGSDRDAAEPGAPARADTPRTPGVPQPMDSAQATAPRSATGDQPPAPPAARPEPADRAHPAVQAYVETMRENPNAVQAQQIAAQVADLSIWRQVLSDWQLNGWGERSVGKMLDRYQKAAGTAPGAPGDPTAAPVSVAAIHTYPGLTDEQRDRWIHRFHAATSPAEKRAVIARMESDVRRLTSDV